MSHVSFSQKAQADVERLVSFMQTVSPQTKDKLIDTLQTGFKSLSVFPEIGRQSRFRADYRELIIPFGKASYVVLYRFDAASDKVTVAAVKHGKEYGF